MGKLDLYPTVLAKIEIGTDQFSCLRIVACGSGIDIAVVARKASIEAPLLPL